jgi:DNA-binding transcriptional regulator YiaG
MTSEQPPLDFKKIDWMRRRMLLSVGDMAHLFGVSRATYYGWLNGFALRKTNDEAVRDMLKRLLSVVTEHSWPTPEAMVAGQKQRREMLIELLNRQ